MLSSQCLIGERKKIHVLLGTGLKLAPTVPSSRVVSQYAKDSPLGEQRAREEILSDVQPLPKEKTILDSLVCERLEASHVESGLSALTSYTQ